MFNVDNNITPVMYSMCLHMCVTSQSHLVLVYFVNVKGNKSFLLSFEGELYDWVITFAACPWIPRIILYFTYYQLHFWFLNMANLLLFSKWILHLLRNWSNLYETFVFITMAVFFYIIRTTKITANTFLKTKSFFLKNLTWMMPMC